MATRITEMMLISTRRFVTLRFGEEAWRGVLAATSEDTRRSFARPLSPKLRFDFPLGMDLLRAMLEALPQEDGDRLLHQLGMHNAEHDLGATEKLLMRALTIKIVLRIASLLWTSRVKDGGRMVILDRGRTAAGCRIESPPDVSVLWWKYLAGWFQRTIELAGGLQVASRWTGGGEQPRDAATFEVSWK